MLLSNPPLQRTALRAAAEWQYRPNPPCARVIHLCSTARSSSCSSEFMFNTSTVVRPTAVLPTMYAP